MDITDVLGPWLLLLVVLLLVIHAERWIHQHAYGIGYLLSQDKATATILYYIIFFPAVVLHEVLQYLVAGVFNVPMKKLKLRPQIQDNGTLRYDFVTIKETDKFRKSFIGGIPFLIAAFLVYYISTSILDLHSIPEALSTNQLSNLLQAIQEQFNTPDFWFWLYLLFAISNGMIPTKEDRAGWWLILAAVGAITVVFLVLGLDAVILETLTGPVHDALELVTISLVIILMVDILVILVFGIIEDTLERWRGFKMDYSGQGKSTKKPTTTSQRLPGSNLPLPKGELMPSIYNLELPLPAIPDERATPRRFPTSTMASPAKSDFPLRPTPLEEKTEASLERVTQTLSVQSAENNPES